MFAMFMAKRLSKALRGKRRWIGVLVNHRYQTRHSLDNLLASITANIESKRPIKLMDFHPSEDEIAIASIQHLMEHDGLQNTQAGVAILQVPLERSEGIRNLLGNEKSLQSMGMKSITTSGKIRLVRERMALPKPVRKR